MLIDGATRAAVVHHQAVRVLTFHWPLLMFILCAVRVTTRTEPASPSAATATATAAAGGGGGGGSRPMCANTTAPSLPSSASSWTTVVHERGVTGNP